RVAFAARDPSGAECECGAAARASRLDVHDRHAGEPERRQDLVPGGDTAVHGPAEGGLEAAPADVRIRERRADGMATEPRERHLGKTPEGVDTHTRDEDGPHGASGAKA